MARVDFGAALFVYAVGRKNEGLKAALASSAVQSVDHSRKIEEQRMSSAAMRCRECLEPSGGRILGSSSSKFQRPL